MRARFPGDMWWKTRRCSPCVDSFRYVPRNRRHRYVSNGPHRASLPAKRPSRRAWSHFRSQRGLQKQGASGRVRAPPDNLGDLLASRGHGVPNSAGDASGGASTLRCEHAFPGGFRRKKKALNGARKAGPGPLWRTQTLLCVSSRASSGFSEPQGQKSTLRRQTALKPHRQARRGGAVTCVSSWKGVHRHRVYARSARCTHLARNKPHSCDSWAQGERVPGPNRRHVGAGGQGAGRAYTWCLWIPAERGTHVTARTGVPEGAVLGQFPAVATTLDPESQADQTMPSMEPSGVVSRPQKPILRLADAVEVAANWQSLKRGGL